MPIKSEPSSRSGFTVGLEYDHISMRGARVAWDGKGGFTMDKLDEVHGDFNDAGGLTEGLRIIKGKLGMGTRDSLVTCLAGKQIFATQLTFRKLPPEEMSQALLLELRKTVSFEIGGASLDYQVLTPPEAKGETIQVLVAVAAAGQLPRHLQILGDAGLTPSAVDVLPIAVANSLWTWVGEPKVSTPKVAVHIGPHISTIVMDGPDSPFFNRYVYFAAEDILAGEQAGRNDSRILSLADEIARSMAFYEKSALSSGFHEVLLLGDFLDTSYLEGPIQQKTGLPVRKLDIPRKLGYAHTFHPGRFDLAATLAIRGGKY